MALPVHNGECYWYGFWFIIFMDQSIQGYMQMATGWLSSWQNNKKLVHCQLIHRNVGMINSRDCCLQCRLSGWQRGGGEHHLFSNPFATGHCSNNRCSHSLQRTCWQCSGCNESWCQKSVKHLRFHFFILIKSFQCQIRESPVSSINNSLLVWHMVEYSTY